MEFVSATEAKPTAVCEDTAEYLITGLGWEAPYCKSCMERMVRSATMYGPEIQVREINPIRN